MGPQRQRSRRGALTAALLLLVSGAAMFQWGRSHSSFDSLRWRGFVVMTAQGKVCLLHTDAAPSGPDRTGLHTVPYNQAGRDATIVRWPDFSYSRTSDPATRESKLTVVAPLWSIAGLCVLPPVWWLLRGRHDARLADEMD